MRKFSPLVAAMATLALLPSAATARKVHYSGHLVDDPTALFSFDAVGQRDVGKHKVVLVPAKVRNFSLTNVGYRCGGPSIPTVETRRSDLPFGFIGPLKVNKHGSFSGRYQPPNSSFSVTGSFRKGKATGSLLGTEGPPSTFSCTTGGHRWVASPAG
jgi:hypothetical protein